MHYSIELSYYYTKYSWDLFEFVFTILAIIVLIKVKKFIRLSIKVALFFLIISALGLLCQNEIIAGYLADLAFIMFTISSIFCFIDDFHNGKI